jgi:RNA polymerase sigma factor (TIGR02999 family)
MPLPDLARTSEILLRVRRGEADAADELLPHVYGELRELAQSLVRRERNGHTLDATALLHEAYLRLSAASLPDLADRRHFVALVARAMRQALIDHARGRDTKKRGGDRLRVTLHDSALSVSNKAIDVLALDEALSRLAELDARKCRVVELRFFGGLTFAESADVLGIAPKTVEADWYAARAWLRRELADEEPA